MRKPKITSMAFACFAVCPVVAIAVLFLIKILSLKNFIFGDDRQQLIWFHPGRIAYPIVDLVREEISIGRFRPLFYQDFNLVSLLSSDLTLNNLAERCFYVQGGMWMLTCVVFLALMAALLKEERKTASAWIFCFIPLSLLAFLWTPAVISYFLMLVFQEKLLCVLLPSFLLFYYTGYRKDNAIFLLVAWLLATVALYCKENTFVVFLTICGVWFLFGRKLLTRRHRTFLLCLLASVAAFFLLYYFIVYRHTVAAYNQDRLWGVVMSTHVMRILRTYPVYVPMIFLGAFRLTRMLFARDRRHLFMDAVLFSALCLFLSFLALGLVDWWYWGTGTVFLFPIMFYWLIVCRNILVRLAGFGVVVVCLLLNRENVANRIAEIDYAQRKDMAFIRQIDQNPAWRRLRYCSFGGNSYIEECMYIYLRDFMEYLGTEGRWRGNVLHETEVSETLDRDDVYVVRTGAVLPDDFMLKMERNLFCCVGECSYFRMFAYRAGRRTPDDRGRLERVAERAAVR